MHFNIRDHIKLKCILTADSSAKIQVGFAKPSIWLNTCCKLYQNTWLFGIQISKDKQCFHLQSSRAERLNECATENKRIFFFFPMGHKGKLLILCKTHYQAANARLVK